MVSLILSPVLLAVSRYNEHEADRFGLEITRPWEKGEPLKYGDLITSPTHTLP